MNRLAMILTLALFFAAILLAWGGAELWAGHHAIGILEEEIKTVREENAQLRDQSSARTALKSNVPLVEHETEQSRSTPSPTPKPLQTKPCVKKNSVTAMSVKLLQPGAEEPPLIAASCGQMVVNLVVPETAGPRLIVGSNAPFSLGSKEIDGTHVGDVCFIGSVGDSYCASIDLDTIRTDPRIDLSPENSGQTFWFATLRVAG